MQFHETGYGRKFLDGDFPKLVRAMEKIAEEMERLNNNLEKSAAADERGQIRISGAEMKEMGL